MKYLIARCAPTLQYWTGARWTESRELARRYDEDEARERAAYAYGMAQAIPDEQEQALVIAANHDGAQAVPAEYLKGVQEAER